MNTIEKLLQEAANQLPNWKEPLISEFINEISKDQRLILSRIAELAPKDGLSQVLTWRGDHNLSCIVDKEMSDESGDSIENKFRYQHTLLALLSKIPEKRLTLTLWQKLMSDGSMRFAIMIVAAKHLNSPPPTQAYSPEEAIKNMGNSLVERILSFSDDKCKAIYNFLLPLTMDYAKEIATSSLSTLFECPDEIYSSLKLSELVIDTPDGDTHNYPLLENYINIVIPHAVEQDREIKALRYKVTAQEKDFKSWQQAQADVDKISALLTKQVFIDENNAGFASDDPVSHQTKRPRLNPDDEITASSVGFFTSGNGVTTNNVASSAKTPYPPL